MSVRYLAEALYEAMRRVEELKARVKEARLEELDELAVRIRAAEAEAAELRRRLEAKKKDG